MELLFDQRPWHHTPPYIINDTVGRGKNRYPIIKINFSNNLQDYFPSLFFFLWVEGERMKLLFSALTVVALILLLSSSLLQQSSAQNNACMQQLLPCMDYLNGTRDPPRTCCDPLKYVIKSEPECLCQMMSVNGANQAERAGINLTHAQQLPGKCGQHIQPLGCILGSPNSRSSSGISFKYPSRILIALSLIIIPIF